MLANCRQIRVFYIGTLLTIAVGCNDEAASPLGSQINNRTSLDAGTDPHCSRLALTGNSLALVAADVPFVDISKKAIRERLPAAIRDFVNIRPDMDSYQEKPQRISFNFSVKYRQTTIPICYRYATAIVTKRGTRITGRLVKSSFDTSMLEPASQQDPRSTQPVSQAKPWTWPETRNVLRKIVDALKVQVSEQEIQTIIDALKDSRSNRFAAQQCLGVVDGQLAPAWRLEFAHNEREYYGEASASELIRAERRFFEIDGHVQAYQEGKVGSRSGLHTITVPTMSEGGSLCSNRFKTEFSDGSPGARSGSSRFIFGATDPRFEEASVFGNASLMSDWFIDLVPERRWLGERLTLFFDQSNNGQNSTAVYLPPKSGRAPTIKLGNGDNKNLRNLRIDPDVISHELGHHFVYKTLTSTSGESVVVHEGLADYFVFAKTGNTCLGESICPKGSAICGSPQCLRSGETRLKYNDPDLPSEAHKKSQVLSGFLWDAHQALTDINMPKLVFASLAYLTAESGMRDYLEALLIADSEEHSGDNSCRLFELAVERGFSQELSGIDCKDFADSK